MKLTTLKDDEGFSKWFQRIIDSNASEILVFDPDTNPSKNEADIYFFFPCGDKRHDVGCGFFSWVTTMKTSGAIFKDIEELREERNLTEQEMTDIFKDHNDWAFSIIVRAEDFNTNDIITHTQDWLAEWVEELACVPVRMVDLIEHRRLWARYEEFHPDPESLDVFFRDMRELNSDAIEMPDGKTYSSDQVRDMLRRIIEMTKEKDEKDDAN